MRVSDPSWRRTTRILFLVVLALGGPILRAIPGAAERFQFDRAAIAAGQFWRVLTGHWAHWSAEHLLWSGGAFALLLFVCAARSFGRASACVTIAAVAVSATVWRWTDLQFYRGLSGIDSALFVLAAVTITRAGGTRRQWATALLLLAFVGKIYAESATGAAVFVSAGDSGMAPVPLAHAVGGAVGLLCALTSRPS
jgi:rhomboid family GlyGly-CTERM serine protease